MLILLQLGFAVSSPRAVATMTSLPSLENAPIPILP
jgi:hypothetical protein